MSLDIYLYGKEQEETHTCSECGGEHTVLTNPILLECNITHNLNTMAKEAGIYKVLWRPEEINATHAEDIIPLLEVGLNNLKSNPEKYKLLNPKNGWGTYEQLVEKVTQYLQACINNPDALIRINR